jgi:murein DD-endopeptidase MepM/ murein hydrolase activator NlpD
MPSKNPERSFPHQQSVEPEPSLWAGIWQSIISSGLRAPLLRYAGHLLVIGIVIIAAWLARFAIWDLLPAEININPPTPTATKSAFTSYVSALPLSGEESSLLSISRWINFHTFMPSRPRSDVEIYTVQSGDSLFAIAKKFNLQPETLLWSNYSALKDDPDLLRPDQQLFILPVDGVYYQWQEGGRLNVVAEKFGVDIVDVISWPSNHLPTRIDPENTGITPGTWLVIPGGHREFVQWQVPVLRRTDDMKWFYAGAGTCRGPYLSSTQGNGFFMWPTASHNTSLGNQYGSYHHAIDIAVNTGDSIVASDSGVVVFAGWSDWGYGNLVVIDHGNGWQTVYAHLSRVIVGCGQDVFQGTPIGMGGSTGNSTGPHLHFEMTINGSYENPLFQLP